MDSTRVERGAGVWLFGPASDMLWGAGLAYVLVFSVLIISTAGVASALPLWLMMFLLVLVSIPHYGATLLRAYERKEDLRSHRLFSIYSTGALLLFFIWGIRDVLVGSILVTLYVTWSPWHYTAQNYGIALMFLGRRGIEIDARTKRQLRMSLLLTFWISFLFVNGPSLYRPFLGTQVEFISLGLPALPADVVMFASLLLYGVTTVLVVAALVKKGLRSAAPALGVVLTQFVWFVLPAVVKNWLPYGGSPIFQANYAQYAMTWIALGHAVQYLWITAYFARATGRASSTASFYGRAILCGSALWAIPMLLFAPGLLGRLPFDGGLASVTAAAVNLHHFVLDGVLWKLRQPRVGGVLLRLKQASADPATRGVAPLRRPMVAVGLASLGILLFGLAEEEFGLIRRSKRGDIAGAERSLDRLAWIGRDSATARGALGERRMRAGDAKGAEKQLEIGVRVFPTSSGWVSLGMARGSQGNARGSMQAYGEALVLEPGNVTAKLLLALAHADLGETAEARALLKQCDRREADTPAIRKLRERLEGVLVLRSGA